LKIKSEHFGSIDQSTRAELPVILSVDPGQRGGPKSSFCVIQAWSPDNNGNHLLLEQWRQQCEFEVLKKAYWKFVRHFRPSVVLIEATANGPALISDARRRPATSIIAVDPDGRPKAARLLTHVPLIRRGHVLLAESALWRADYVKELVDFPSAPFDDQVDATTQYLDWITTNPVPALPKARALVGRVDGLPLGRGPHGTIQVPGAVSKSRNWL
jgi:predicted phage terminase large subunit-like protein